MDIIIGQNSKAIAFLRNQDFSKAIEVLSAALKCLRSLQCAAESKEDRCDERRYAHSDCLDQCMLLSKVEDESSFEASRVVFIYGHGISLQSEVSDADTVTAILLFNTALAHQMLAIEKQQYQVLQKARRLYGLAYNSYDMDHNILFRFAVINNMIVIDQKLGNTAKQNECLEHLMSLFMVFVDQGCDMHLRHVQGFLVNLPWTINTALAA
ncbi:unnamed protein product [Cylindrotheca closterium]|uniref:Uncharacterized protein n=1 Tax=Cylindrotheca closterium TaxID=2856 RepID=A0AAD2JNJ0_9STRA|nr:unnamed protein product [Cylindrotheca closterium]